MELYGHDIMAILLFYIGRFVFPLVIISLAIADISMIFSY